MDHLSHLAPPNHGKKNIPAKTVLYLLQPESAKLQQPVGQCLLLRLHTPRLWLRVQQQAQQTVLLGVFG
jgi:hypothetical protein